jgi:hypothetical protein
VFITGVVGVALFGTYGGLGVVPESWGSLLVAVIATLCHRWGTRAARARIRTGIEEAAASTP